MNTRTIKLLLTTLLFCSLYTYGASAQTVNLPSAELTVQQSIDRIKSETGNLVSYNLDQLDPSRVVRFSSASLPLDDMLGQMVAGTNLEYARQGKHIFFRERRTQQVQPTGTQVLSSRYGDRYERNSYDNFNNVNRRRPLAPPVITISEPTRVVQDTTRSRNLEDFTSHIVPIAAYTENRLPVFALKINLLYGLATLTPNIAAEVGLGRRTTLELSGSYNPWRLNGTLEDNKKWAHYIIRPEFRYWLCERFNGHFFGVHALWAEYNVGTVDVPLLFDKENRYEGYAVGGGITYGYHLPLSKRWGVEFNVGLGVAHLKYDLYPCASCNYNPEKGKTKTYFGPTRAGITLTFNIK